MIVDEEVYLEHWGVKGMRWGVRNRSNKMARNHLNRTAKVGKLARKAKDKFLDDLDLPGRPNRRSNRLSPEQLAKENSTASKIGKIAVATGLLAYGALNLSQISR